MSKRQPKLLLEDILEAIAKIETYTAGMIFSQFETDTKTVDAVIRNLEIIGEAARQLPDEFTEQHHQIPWYQIIGLRNRVIHDYFGVDLSIIWKIVQEDLGRFQEMISKLT